MRLNKNGKQIAILITMFLLAVFFWDSILVYPIKLFVVLLHEMSHGLMAVLLGGKVISVEISRYIGGHIVYAAPPGRLAEILVASSGYLGSMFWGGLILILASKTKKDRYISLAIGIVTLCLSYYVIKSGELFGIIFTLLFAGLMILSYKYLDDWFHDYMLKFIGLTSCLYVILDIKNDLIERSGIGSDADRIAQLTWIPSIVVGIFWAVLACILLYYILKITFSGTQIEGGKYYN